MNTTTNEILRMIKEEDEALCGCDWEEMYANENVIDTYEV